MDSLSAEERARIAEARALNMAACLEKFNLLDIDGSGSVSKAEISKLANDGIGIPEAVDPETREQKINELISRFDADGDGNISKDEWLNFFGSLYDALVEEAMRRALGEEQ